MSVDTAYAGADEVRKLDDRLLSLEREILDIKQQRNRLAPISRLPVEVHASIFLDCARSLDSATHS